MNELQKNILTGVAIYTLYSIGTYYSRKTQEGIFDKPKKKSFVTINKIFIVLEEEVGDE